MSLAPSTYYYRARAKSVEAVAVEARLVARIREICAEFPRYGYRRVTAQLEAEGERVNHKRLARIMREQDLRVRRKRRLVVTTRTATTRGRSSRTWPKAWCRVARTSSGSRI